MKVKMTSHNILNLVLIILTFLSTNPQAKLIHQKRELNGENLLLIYAFVRRLLKNILLTFPRGFRKNPSAGACFSKVPRTFRTPKASYQTAIRLFRKADF